MSIETGEGQVSTNYQPITELAVKIRRAELSDERFIKIQSGTKEPVESHSNPDNRYRPAEIDGDYGVYSGDGLVIFDIDRYDGPIPNILSDLPETFKVKSPHDGTHLYYSVPDDLSEQLDEKFEVTNPNVSWGEIRVKNQYVIGPGSQLDGCEKESCDECEEPTGGRYQIQKNVDIAELSTEQVLEIVRGDPAYGDSPPKDVETSTSPQEIQPEDFDVNERLETALEKDDTFFYLWNGNFREVGFEEDRSGAEWALVGKLAFWFGPDEDLIRDLMNRAEPPKWSERGEMYRERTLRAVESQNEFYTPSSSVQPSEKKPTTEITQEDARSRCQESIAEALQSADNHLIEALPTLGKTYGTIKAVAETGNPITFVTSRHKLYEQIQDWCADFGLSVKRLPSVTEDCPTFNKKHGSDWKKRAKKPYKRGATAGQIHAEWSGELPCTREGACSYQSGWKFDGSDYDVLVGNYKHLNKDRVLDGRTVVVDEYPEEAFDTVLSDNLESVVTNYLTNSSLPFEDFTELIEQRDGSDGAEALETLGEDIEPDRSNILDEEKAHADAPVAVYTLLAGREDAVNGFERAELPNGGIGLYDRDNGELHLRRPPALADANGVIGLDGTPIPEMWENVLGTSLQHETVLSDAERRGYLTGDGGLGHELIRTDEYARSYSGSGNANISKDEALLWEIANRHDEEIALITTKKAKGTFGEEGLIEYADAVKHYGKLKSSNEFEEFRVGVVIGSRHYGDRHVEREAAFAGELAERDGRGIDLSYGDYGDSVLQNMREHETLQAALRFGRDGSGATIYVHTNTLPDWVSFEVVDGVSTPFSDGMLEVQTALQGESALTTEEVTDRVPSIGERQVRDHLNTLESRGYACKEKEGYCFKWSDNGLSNANPYAFVSIQTDS